MICKGADYCSFPFTANSNTRSTAAMFVFCSRQSKPESNQTAFETPPLTRTISEEEHVLVRDCSEIIRVVGAVSKVVR